MKTLLLKNGVELALLGGDEYLGIGEVRIAGTRMRDGRRAMLPEIRTPEGVLMVQPRLELEAAGEGYDLKLRYSQQADGLMEWMLHTVRNRLNVADWSDGPQPCDAVLTIRIRPVERTLEGTAYTGFSYQFHYTSQEFPIYRILDRSTWEPGGSLLGSEFWLRAGTVPAIWECTSLDEKYSTEWYLPPIEQPNIFQFFPWQMAMQGFTLTCSAEGTLLCWASEVAHVRSLFEKHRGKDAMFTWHEHCGDLAHEFLSSPVEVLWAPGATDRVDRLNRHEAARAFIWSELHRQVGLQEERIGTYGVLEEWGIPDFDRYRETALPAFAEAGIKTIMVPNEFENNMNVWGLSNMCCNVDFKVAETVGEERFRRFCREASDAGIVTEMWGNTALSTLNYVFNLPDGKSDRIRFLPKEGSIMEVLDSARAPWVRNASGAIEADHYTPVFCQLNLREPKVTEYWHRQWSALKDGVGVRGIFIDSSFNMSGDKFTWRQNDEFDRPGGATIDQTSLLGQGRPDREPRKTIETQYFAYLELLREMQGYGYALSTEDVGVFGVSRSGPSLAMRAPSLPLWQETYGDFDPTFGDDIFFRGLAYRVMWKLIWHIPSEALSWNYDGVVAEHDRPTDWQLSLLKAFTDVSQAMVKRTVLDGERGVRWEGAGTTLYWAFQELTVPVPNGSWMEVLPGGERLDGSEVVLPARTVGRIRS